MATSPLDPNPNLNAMAPPMPAPPPAQDEPTPSDPFQGQKKDDPKTTPDANGLNEHDRENLMFVRRHYKEKYSLQRRARIRKVSRMMEYLKGNQYYVVGPDGFSFVDPFSTPGGDTEQGTSSDDYYKYVTNIIQWFERGIVSTIAGQVTSIRFQPANASSDKGNRIAQEASHANAYLERMNDEGALQQQKASYLALDGCYFQYDRAVRDERLSGDRTEANFEETMETRQVKPNRYLCPNCGDETPQDQMAVQNQTACFHCQQPVGEADFYPALNLPMPVMKPATTVPPVQVRSSLYGSMHVDADPQADCETGDPLLRTPMLDLSLEVDLGDARAMFPDYWEEFAGGGETAGSGDADVDRMARLRLTSQGSSANWYERGGNPVIQTNRPTYSRTWLQPEAFNCLPQKADADKLRTAFQKGCLLFSWNGKYLGANPKQLTKAWTWGGTRRGLGLYPPAMLDPAIDFQDRVNDAGNTQAEFYDRMAVPGVAYDAKAINGKGLSGKYWATGTWFPVSVKPKEGRTLESVLWQPKFNMDKGIETYEQRLITMAQMVISVPPQLFGQGQMHIDTARGQDQALTTAKSNLGLVWTQMRGQGARASLNRLRCLSENATDEMFDVIKGDDGRFENQPLDMDALKNEMDAYADPEEGFPEAEEAMRDRWQKILEQGQTNPLVLEMLQPMKNRRIVGRIIFGQDIEIPEEAGRIKVLEDISRLLEGQPSMQPDPVSGQMVMMPSVLPDKAIDDLALTQITVKEYVTENYWQLKAQQPAQFENVLAYLQCAAQFEKEQQIAAAPPQAGPPGSPPTPMNGNPK